MHELPAERLSLGHQLLVGGRAVKGVHDLGGKNRRAPQHLHGGDAGRGRRTCGQTALSPAWLAEGKAGRARRAGRGAVCTSIESAHQAGAHGKTGRVQLQGRAAASRV